MFLYCDGRSFSSRYVLLPKAKFVEGMDLSHRCAKRWGSRSFCLSVCCSTYWRIGPFAHRCALCLCVCVCLSLSQLGWNVLKWNHFGLRFYLFILQCWSSNAIFRKLEICELIGQLEDVSQESGSMLVVQLGSLLVVDICIEDVCSFTIWAPSC